MISRRKFVQDVALAGAAGLVGFGRDAYAAEPPPETKRMRIGQIPDNCYAPQYMAEQMLRGEGFSELQYVRLTTSGAIYIALAKGEIDLSMAFSSGFVIQADAGAPIVMLAGIHPGCLELVASSRIRSVRDLKGRSVAVGGLNSAAHGFLASIVGHVGLDPRRDINWVVVEQSGELLRQLADGKVDATIAGPPLSYEMRAKKIGHVLVNMTTDRPWSQYFCCVLTGNREFVRKNPVATKRAMRAILKGANLCASPEPTAKHLVSRGFYKNHDITLQMLRDLPYARWRDYDSEDTVRYYALRLQEAGLIKSGPKKILAEATDFRFLNDLKRELKT
ncbi:MAG: ABC transporter substrate-binding protein [Betaproteobacteria bacterium]|nr:ABC transporter substrate-binding protein [Betaproteobacteria bacterium]